MFWGESSLRYTPTPYSFHDSFLAVTFNFPSLLV